MNAPPPTFATVLNCMDGRVQLLASAAVRAAFGVAYVDTITHPGIVRYVSDQTDTPETATMLANVRISINKHGSRAIAVAAHDHCAGNPVSDDAQKAQLGRGVRFLAAQFPDCEIVGLWVSVAGTTETIALASTL